MKKRLALLLLLGLLPLAACRGGTAPLTELPAEEVTELPAEEEPEKKERVGYVCVQVDGLNVRAGAGTGFPSLGTVQKNTLLAYLGEEDGWIRTLFRGGPAYVGKNARYVRIFEMERGGDEVEAVIAEGTRLLGVPYVYGAVRHHDGAGRPLKGFTEDEFDCSSLMQYIFYRGAAVVLDVTTRTQVLQGEEVARGSVRRGDLLFFTNAARRDKRGLERIGHVALYLGEDLILHTASDVAKIEPISPLRESYFVTARRMI